MTEPAIPEDELTKKTAELERSNQELEQFAYVASHDLQEPLRKILLFSERLLSEEKERLSPTGQSYLSRLHNGAERMRRLIEDLLQYARVTSKARTLEAVDLNRIIEEIQLDLEASLEKTQGQILTEKLPTVSSSSLHMRQLFYNLILNGLKYQKPESKPCVKVSSHPLSDGSFEVHIVDNGIGFEEKYLDKIFQPFQRLHNQSEYEGSGIGLAVCQKIVDYFGGKLTARSQLGEGATFIVTFPATMRLDK